jgi:hypothetical protein
MGIDNTGVADSPSNSDQLADESYTPPAAPIIAKETLLSQITPDIEYALLTGQYPPLGQSCPDGDCAPRAQNIANQPLKPQETTYTCGPASTRLMILQMTGTDIPEKDLAAEEHTSSKTGTTVTAIPKTLNAHQSQSVFALKTVGGQASDYMSIVVSDVHYGHHGIINNVLTTSLSFWGGHRARHYDTTYGYDLGSGGTVAVAEEWDPTRFHISLRGYGDQNPYGYHEAEPVQNVWTAVRQSTSGRVVW